MPLIDTHTHLCDPVFDPDREVVLARALEAGIDGVIAVSETLEDAHRTLRIAGEYPGRIFPAIGLFPTFLDLDEAGALVDLVRAERARLVAIGEVGLDYWKVQDPTERELQRQIFSLFIDLALEVDLPLNVHARSCGRQTIALLIERGATRVQMHAFDGRAAKALPALEAGYFFSIPASVVRSPQKQKLVRRLPLEQLLIETDSPVRGPPPQPLNEPANARISLQAIAEIKELPLEVVVEAICENTRRLYGEMA